MSEPENAFVARGKQDRRRDPVPGEDRGQTGGQLHLVVAGSRASEDLGHGPPSIGTEGCHPLLLGLRQARSQLAEVWFESRIVDCRAVDAVGDRARQGVPIPPCQGYDFDIETAELLWGDPWCLVVVREHNGCLLRHEQGGDAGLVCTHHMVVATGRRPGKVASSRQRARDRPTPRDGLTDRAQLVFDLRTSRDGSFRHDALLPPF